MQPRPPMFIRLVNLEDWGLMNDWHRNNKTGEVTVKFRIFDLKNLIK